jgi:hypothetical protein
MIPAMHPRGVRSSARGARRGVPGAEYSPRRRRPGQSAACPAHRHHRGAAGASPRCRGAPPRCSRWRTRSWPSGDRRAPPTRSNPRPPRPDARSLTRRGSRCWPTAASAGCGEGCTRCWSPVAPARRGGGGRRRARDLAARDGGAGRAVRLYLHRRFRPGRGGLARRHSVLGRGEGQFQPDCPSSGGSARNTRSGVPGHDDRCDGARERSKCRRAGHAHGIPIRLT